MYYLGQVLQHKIKDEYVIYLGFSDGIVWDAKVEKGCKDWAWLFWNPERGFFFGTKELAEEYMPVFAKDGQILPGDFISNSFFGWLYIEKFREKDFLKMERALLKVQVQHLKAKTGKRCTRGSKSPGLIVTIP